ncbi:MAG: hypothetical protein VX453_14920 [Acidobacteriota bacterium]|nr:hypothetical protein [Acidobacteriota bacterium]
MGRRWIRIFIVVVAFVALGFSGNQIRHSEFLLEDQQSVERVFTELSWALTLKLADLKAAQQAYVADGQDNLYWTTRVTAQLQAVRESLANLRRLVVNPGSSQALDTAAEAIADLEKVDQQAREHTSREQALLASDLIFTDGLELANRASAQVELARATERATRNETVRAARATQAQLLLVSAGVGILTILLLTPLRRPPALMGLSGSETEAEVSTTGVESDNFNGPSGSLSAEGQSDHVVVSGVPSQPRPTPNLQETAELCTEFSNLADVKALPGLLARSATLINASGLIIWARDPDNHVLRPAGEHGYGQEFLKRIDSIPENGNNPTATAFRDTNLQVVAGVDSIKGALALPLMANDRCVGVLSAELRDGWESNRDVHAIATILAAQLATLLPDSAPADSDIAAEAHG